MVYIYICILIYLFIPYRIYIYFNLFRWCISDNFKYSNGSYNFSLILLFLYSGFIHLILEDSEIAFIKIYNSLKIINFQFFIGRLHKFILKDLT